MKHICLMQFMMLIQSKISSNTNPLLFSSQQNLVHILSTPKHHFTEPEVERWICCVEDSRAYHYCSKLSLRYTNLNT